jgi:hypothetical protein
LAIELSLLRDKSDLPTEVRDRVQALEQMTSDISMGVHTLSHELHSSTLEHLGLVGGMTGWCRDYGVRRNLKIDFKSHDVPKLPQEVSLCLFRVLQEALPVRLLLVAGRDWLRRFGLRSVRSPPLPMRGQFGFHDTFHCPLTPLAKRPDGRGLHAMSLQKSHCLVE